MEDEIPDSDASRKADKDQVLVPGRIGILGSGRGSNARSIIEATRKGTLEGEVALILSDVEDSGILHIAREFGIPSRFVDPGQTKGGRLSDAALTEILSRLQDAEVDLVALAGFMRIVREPLLSAFPGMMLNIHPSLLPKHPGLNVCKKAIEAGDSESGCTIHLVDAGIDTGKILRRERVPILPGDSPGDLQARIQEREHIAFPEVIHDLLTGKQG